MVAGAEACTPGAVRQTPARVRPPPSRFYPYADLIYEVSTQMATSHLYRGRGTPSRQLKSFKARYGARAGYVYGATVGKVAREQARLRGEKRERVREHRSTTRLGVPEYVRSHEARLEGSRYGPIGSYETEIRTHEVRPHRVRAHLSRSKRGRIERVRGHVVRGYRVARHGARVTIIGLKRYERRAAHGIRRAVHKRR